jgi:hypothetical protein
VTVAQFGFLGSEVALGRVPAVAVVPLDEGEDVGAGLVSGRPVGRPDLGLQGRETALRHALSKHLPANRGSVSLPFSVFRDFGYMACPRVAVEVMRSLIRLMSLRCRSVDRTNATASSRNSLLYFDERPTQDTPFLAR